MAKPDGPYTDGMQIEVVVNIRRFRRADGFSGEHEERVVLTVWTDLDDGERRIEPVCMAALGHAALQCLSPQMGRMAEIDPGFYPPAQSIHEGDPMPYREGQFS